MRILVTGAGGMLAHDLVPALRGRGHDVLAVSRHQLDVTDRVAVASFVRASRPDVAVQCAAFTAVDAAETQEAAAHLVNATSTHYLAAACHDAGARLVYPSTDYVFAGDKNEPYQPADPPAPVNAYGRSKLAGERAALESPGALVVRTSWLYGGGGGNFVDTIVRMSRERDRIDVVNDQIGRPTWTVPLARTILDLLERGVGGIFHATGGGEPATWYDVAERIIVRTARSVDLRAVATSEFPRPAARPGYSVLDCTATESTIGRPLPDWKDSLFDYLGDQSANAGAN
jgi:dTDP-4-dehydrorhamnose reductase